ncbi:hypothetical protein [Polaribacter ponticola]|uniref:Uncharacterized protein n=1 Tax=Polaribacter ponticola TaxID=2978475 RepID=A0ABT5S838_9FLAO|nr:hypothetical protein [Polaribacter sp. MSW5]MDD7914278.1 hypothetical protein [Polaribacter sp. MSW5]
MSKLTTSILKAVTFVFIIHLFLIVALYFTDSFDVKNFFDYLRLTSLITFIPTFLSYLMFDSKKKISFNVLT